MRRTRKITDPTDILVRDVGRLIGFCIRRRRRVRHVFSVCYRLYEADASSADVILLDSLLFAVKYRGAYGVREMRALERLYQAEWSPDTVNEVITRLRARAGRNGVEKNPETDPGDHISGQARV